MEYHDMHHNVNVTAKVNGVWTYNMAEMVETHFIYLTGQSGEPDTPSYRVKKDSKVYTLYTMTSQTYINNYAAGECPDCDRWMNLNKKM
jgi:hypothetical protein